MDFHQSLLDLLRSIDPDLLPFLRAQYKLMISGAALFAVSTALILLVEHYVPAKPGQRLFSKGLVVDFFWFCATALLVIPLTMPLLRFLRNDLGPELAGSFTLTVILDLPMWMQVIWSFFIGDFLAWFHHMARHKVPFMWPFHAVHHSQQEMNFLTNQRGHPLDRIFSRLIAFLPAAILLPPGVAAPSIVAFAVFLNWYQRFYHANIRMDFGVLRYVLVTPQSHRVHHSSDPDHLDKNYGVIFCIWDRLFGTHVDVPLDRCPDTGIADREFPTETTVRWYRVPLIFMEQWIYPFIDAWRGMTGKGRL